MIATTTLDGTKVMLDNGSEAMEMMDLESHRARQLYTMMKEQRPERFNQMKMEGILIGYLNETALPYYQQAKELVLQGTPVFLAEETAWQDLMERAGL